MFNKKLNVKVRSLEVDVEALEKEVARLKSTVIDLRVETIYKAGSWFRNIPTVTVKDAIYLILKHLGKDIVKNDEKMPDKFKMVDKEKEVKE